MRVSAIAAIGPNRELGKDNKLLWHIPEDLKLFKQLTLGHCLIMGRKTFESIGRPLPGRTTIVITRNSEWSYPEVLVADSIENSLQLAKEKGFEEAYIAGGQQIYSQAQDLIERMYLSRVDSFNGLADCFYPEISWEQYQLKEEKKYSGEGKSLDFTFQIWDKLGNSLSKP